MKLLIHSPSPESPTGYGQIVRNIAPRLQAMGHEVGVFQYNGGPGTPKRGKDGVTYYPRDNSYTGFELLPDMAAYHKADRVLSVCDPWIVPTHVWQKLDQPPVFWLPIQCQPVHVDYRETLDVAGDIWVYSEFGAGVLRAAGYDCVHMPLGYDPALYADLDKDEARRWFEQLTDAGLQGKKLIGMVAANASTVPGPRKGLDIALRALKMLHETSPGEYFLYMHTRKDGRHIGGIDLDPVISYLGLDGVVGFPDRLNIQWGAPDWWMAKVMAAFDVLWAPSMAEGFGLPLLEAQMAGTPVVTVAHGTMPELVGHGYCVLPAALQWADGAPGGEVAVADAREIAWATAQDMSDVDSVTMGKLRGWTWDAIAQMVHERLAGG